MNTAEVAATLRADALLGRRLSIEEVAVLLETTPEALEHLTLHGRGPRRASVMDSHAGTYLAADVLTWVRQLALAAGGSR